MTTLAVLALFSIFLAPCLSQTPISPENRLRKDLMTNYNSGVRPLYDPNKQMTILVSFVFKKIESFDEQNQVLNSFGWIAMLWTDELLRWSPANYNKTARLVLPAGNIWLPEVAMYNSVNQGNDLSMDVKFRASVTYDGSVLFAPGFKWSTACKVSLEIFPYDTQVCNVTFVNWVYSNSLLTYSSLGIDLSNYEANDQWDLLDASANHGILGAADEEDGPSVPQVYFTLTLKRKPMYYVLNVVVPCFMISLLSCMVFLMPSDAGEKVSLAITVLLSYTILLLMVSEVTPKSGVSMPYISIFIILNMGLTALSLVLTTIIMTFYHHPGNHPPPACLRKSVFGIIAKMVCMSSEAREHNGGKVSPLDVKSSLASILRQSDVEVHELDHRHPQKENDQTKGLLPADVLTYIRYLMEKEKDREAEEQCRAEWVSIGRVMDRFMLYVFLIFIVVSIVIFMCLVRT